MLKVSLIFLKRKNKLLLYLRDNKNTILYPNHWSFIGGEAEDNENPLETLKREIGEEISCEVKNIEYIEDIKFLGEPPYFGREDIVSLFKGDIDEDIENIILTEGQRLSYFTFEQFKSLKVVPFLKEYIIKNKNKIF